ncbi:Uncharacterized protein, contains FMN-binding domain [Clostridium acidisoli DSM 12555]|jgi:uncharacterized protein with FMN-binding domain|uniref:Uncharacterized protein, contains FMN-binding domain n=1 Tax=Clostridium acidisoli DSM 12555 TaxID=1121291 RepID=A0A1W1XD20_9CLOT|nr:FMN-binding protein [Clostridium acidisoli]SMC21787.1 Uncharacterized protein, contains FMN-binding domain [Clostridium acidisoli DSM 12555]
MVNTKRIIYAVTALAIVVGVSLGARYYIKLQNYNKIINGISIKEVNLAKVSDGTYKGSFDALMIEADTSVTVKNHKIVDIKLLHHKNERGKPAEVIPMRVVKAQSLKVDTVSGATNSSKVILMSIQKALEKGSIKS